jgi:hypothetical protein
LALDALHEEHALVVEDHRDGGPALAVIRRLEAASELQARGKMLDERGHQGSG